MEEEFSDSYKEVGRQESAVVGSQWQGPAVVDSQVELDSQAVVQG